jgi:ABC-type glycerol-3-phosphate transport system substrate-binding protein
MMIRVRGFFVRNGSAFGIGILGLALLSGSGCTSKNRVWIYTSMYKEVIAEMKPQLERALPDIEVRWYQGGSENVAARINTELFAGRTQADLILKPMTVLPRVLFLLSTRIRSIFSRRSGCV